MNGESSWIDRVWWRRGFSGRVIHWALRPLALGFAAAVRVRGLAYALRLRRGARIGVPVVSIGNLSVGGTGKTPTALWLGRALVERGYRVALVSRGYGGRRREPTLVGRESVDGVASSDDWAEVGDEAILLARRFDGPVVVGRRRVDAGVVAARSLGADVVLLDDGFQHRRIARDFDLVLVRAEEAERGVTLPAGNLREPRSALRRADAVLVTKGELSAAGEARLRRHLGERPLFRGDLRAHALVSPLAGRWTELPMGHLAGRRVFAVAAIAHPEPFWRSITEWEARIEDSLEFPDHHAYGTEDWKKISLRSRDLDLVVTTEKDLVKLERFPFAREKLVALRTTMEVERGEELIERIVDRIGAPAAERT
jgi:tetraacyldisaccharide 4'-kinase